jgi:hypothetical protein
MRRLLAIAALLIAAIPPIHASAANSWGTDVSDLWWNPNENGWGANIAHQGEVLFLTLFVYGSDSQVKWYVGSALASQGGNSAYTFSGPLYQTTGPFLGGTFNPSNVGVRQVGTATVTLTAIESATLSYSVDGVSVTKSIQRQTFRNNNLSGSYIGALIGSATGCGSNSGSFAHAAQASISHSGTTVSIAASLDNGLSCTYPGTYQQSGRMGSIVGTFSCSNGGRGTYEAFEIESSYQGFFMRYNANWGGGCLESGRIGGMKR